MQASGLQFYKKKELWHRCFPMYFTKFLRTPFFIEHLRWLLFQKLISNLEKNFVKTVILTKKLYDRCWPGFWIHLLFRFTLISKKCIFSLSMDIKTWWNLLSSFMVPSAKKVSRYQITTCWMLHFLLTTDL